MNVSSCWCRLGTSRRGSPISTDRLSMRQDPTTLVCRVPGPASRMSRHLPQCVRLACCSHLRHLRWSPLVPSTPAFPMSVGLRVNGKDTDGNYLAVCRAPEAAENGLRLDALGNLIAITVLRGLSASRSQRARPPLPRPAPRAARDAAACSGTPPGAAGARPEVIVDAGPAAVERFLEFFAPAIANEQTRAAYGRLARSPTDREQPAATPPDVPGRRRPARTLNEGRGVNPGDTRAGLTPSAARRRRSSACVVLRSAGSGVSDAAGAGVVWPGEGSSLRPPSPPLLPGVVLGRISGWCSMTQ